MKLCLLLLLTVCASMARPALAGPPIDDCATKGLSGEAGIFADVAGTELFFTVAPFTPFNLYVVAHDLPGGVLGYEFSVTGTEGLTLLSSSFVGRTNLGDVPLEYIVATGSCLDGSGAFLMATLNMGSFQGADLVDKAVCLRGSDPSSFEAFNRSPGYAQCDGSLRPFTAIQWCGGGVYPNGCAILNATYVWCPVDDASFGTLKATF